ncbi:MAG: hypothetical protein IKL97_04235 [Eggerthellaceae bacterium]|nr:hypothetical protein [Eggerthellaceae bacterium]
MSKKPVKVTCGTIDESYRGIADPKLEVVFLQTEEERAKYEPIMKRLQEEGLATQGTTISGI